ncbi:PREDICTED: uncharacterized protein C12orf45 homolog [Tinamus guttatus]|nr:PREDICTED: uncharacterized protein C12orf45 homolog [Tinamus guttatus]
MGESICRTGAKIICTTGVKCTAPSQTLSQYCTERTEQPNQSAINSAANAASSLNLLEAGLGELMSPDPQEGYTHSGNEEHIWVKDVNSRGNAVMAEAPKAPGSAAAWESSAGGFVCFGKPLSGTNGFGFLGPAASRELLAVGRRGGLEETLLISSKLSKKKATTLQTVRMPRSNILDRVQNFLPQMAHANDELRRKMLTAPAHQFDIENLDTATGNVVEMNVALVELSGSDTDEEVSLSDDDSESEDDCTTDEVTIDNIKFPKQKGEKGKIEILDSKVNE